MPGTPPLRFPPARPARALGEFLLIVLGVVVALGVDRWVQARDERAAELDHLELVRRDLEANLALFQRLEEDWATAADASAYLLQVLDGEVPAPDDGALYVAVERAGTVNTQPARSASFRALEGTGGLRLIRDVELRTRIIEYFTQAIVDGRPALEERTDLRFRTFAREHLPPAAPGARALCPPPTAPADCSISDPPPVSGLLAAMRSAPEIRLLLRIRQADGQMGAGFAAAWEGATRELLDVLEDRVPAARSP